MSQELLYTSAPRGLKPGSRGFCTVLSTQGMAAPLATALEGLSGYRPLFPTGDERAFQNPVVYSHLKLQCAGRAWHVLSRIADYGLDYSQRANKLAHHLVLDKNELTASGPATLLSTPSVMRMSWEGEPKVVPLRSITRDAASPTGPCRAWARLTGDAGWAGVVAESFLNDAERLVILLFAPGQDILPLFIEAISLLPPERRWDVTFSTYFTGLATGTSCAWRALVHDSKEAHESIRFVNALRLDLTAGSCGVAYGGPLVEAARTGIRSSSSEKPITGVRESHYEQFSTTENSPIVFERAGDHQAELAADEETVDLATRTHRPPRLTPTRQTVSADSSMRPDLPRRLADGGEEESSLRRWRGWRVIFTVIVILLGITLSLGAAIQVFRIGYQRKGSTTESRALAGVVPGASASDVRKPDSISAAGTGDRAHSTPTTQREKPVTDVQTVTSKIAGSTDTPASPEPSTGKTGMPNDQSGSPSPSDTVVQQVHPQPAATPLLPKIPEKAIQIPKLLDSTPIYEFDWPGEKPIPKHKDFVRYFFAAPISQQLFKAEFENSPPTLSLLVPDWLGWRVSPETKPTGNTLAEIKSPDAVVGHSCVTLIRKPATRTFTYLLKRNASEDSKHLAWCVFDVKEFGGAIAKRIFLSSPAAIDGDQTHFSKTQLKIMWKSTFPMDKTWHPQLRIEDVTIQAGERHWATSSTAWDTSTEMQLSLKSLGESLRTETGTTTLLEPSITMKASNDADFLTISISLNHVFEKNGIFALAAKEIEAKGQELIPSDIGELGKELSSLVKQVLDLQSPSKNKNADPMQTIAEKITSYVEKTIPGLRSEAKDNTKTLDDLKNRTKRLTDLPEALNLLRTKSDKLEVFRRDCESMSVISASISYSVRSWSDTRSTEKPVNVFVVKFGEANKRDSTAGENSP